MNYCNIGVMMEDRFKAVLNFKPTSKHSSIAYDEYLREFPTLFHDLYALFARIDIDFRPEYKELYDIYSLLKYETSKMLQDEEFRDKLRK